MGKPIYGIIDEIRSVGFRPSSRGSNPDSIQERRSFDRKGEFRPDQLRFSEEPQEVCAGTPVSQSNFPIDQSSTTTLASKADIDALKLAQNKLQRTQEEILALENEIRQIRPS